MLTVTGQWTLNVYKMGNQHSYVNTKREFDEDPASGKAYKHKGEPCTGSMTKINNITIHGFKSLVKKTQILNFGDKYNCILGPNGAVNRMWAMHYVLYSGGYPQKVGWKS